MPIINVRDKQQMKDKGKKAKTERNKGVAHAIVKV